MGDRESISFDVLIVGAGPAGLIAAGVTFAIKVSNIFNEMREKEAEAQKEFLRKQDELRDKEISHASSLGSALGDAIRNKTMDGLKQAVNQFLESKILEKVGDTFSSVISKPLLGLDHKLESLLLDDEANVNENQSQRLSLSQEECLSMSVSVTNAEVEEVEVRAGY